jgi:phosphatidylethanolamine-binding protein (PEBP) family uncharacterized protein
MHLSNAPNDRRIANPEMNSLFDKEIAMKKLSLILLTLGFLYTATIWQIRTSQQPRKESFTLHSSTFVSHGHMPAKYTCDGENVSPKLHWKNAPKGTKSFALIVDDPDAPEKRWVHWLLFNIPAETNSLPEGVKSGNFISGETDFYYMRHGIWQYGGPY